MRVPDYPSEDVNRWSAVDDYFAGKLIPSDQSLDTILQNNSEAGLPPHDVSATQGKMLALFVKMTRANRILEIGTLGGYSTLWMARALPPNGKIVTIEANEMHSSVAQQNIEHAGLADHVEMHVGAALDVLPRLKGPFDLIFIDADKPNNPSYIRWALQLSRPGTVIICDNVVRGGAVIDPASEDPSVRGVREFVDIVAHEARLQATAIQTVGEKGWDGFVMALVTAE
jgi:predicted O-methyltransferase YrrM